MERIDSYIIIGIATSIIFILLLGVYSITSLKLNTKDSVTIDDTKQSGSLSIGGSTTVYPLVLKASEVFMQLHPNVNITITQSSTGEGIQKFLDNKIDIISASRPLHKNEYSLAKSEGKDPRLAIISNDAVILVVHKSNPLNDISIEQLNKIYFTGEITDWSQLTNGKKTGKIHIYGTNPQLSGTAELFISKVSESAFERAQAGQDKIFVSDYNLVYPTPSVVPTVGADSDGLGFTPQKWTNDAVKVLSINRVYPAKNTVLDGSYKLARKMMVITDGKPQGLAMNFIGFILSREGQKIVEEEGFIPII